MRRLLIVLALAALVAVACGDGDQPQEPTAEPTTTTQPTATVSLSAEEASYLEEIRASIGSPAPDPGDRLLLGVARQICANMSDGTWDAPQAARSLLEAQLDEAETFNVLTSAVSHFCPDQQHKLAELFPDDGTESPSAAPTHPSTASPDGG